jgi:hypothetical protein
MQEIGCCDISQVDLAFQVYIELCEGNYTFIKLFIAKIKQKY